MRLPRSEHRSPVREGGLGPRRRRGAAAVACVRLCSCYRAASRLDHVVTRWDPGSSIPAAPKYLRFACALALASGVTLPSCSQSVAPLPPDVAPLSPDAAPSTSVDVAALVDVPDAWHLSSTCPDPASA